MSKFIPRALAAALITACAFCLFGCAAKQKLDPNEAFSRLLNEVKYENALVDESELAELMLELPEGTEARFYSAGGASEDVLIMLKAPEGTDAAALDAALDGYLAERLYDAERYSPEQVKKLETPARYSDNGCVILCVTDDIAAALAILAGA